MPKAVKVPQFDNLDDVNSKFKNTVCYYEDKAVLVKACGYQQDPETGKFIEGKFLLNVATYNNRGKDIKLEDPKFRYKDYNLGYANHAHSAVWWFRKPLKQYQQGLKRDQLANICSFDPFHEENFSFAPSYIDMLENDYPSMVLIKKQLQAHQAQVMAFHKNFAVSWDDVHEDFVLEYRGKKVGVSLNGNLDEYKLLPEFKHLAEALQEALA